MKYLLICISINALLITSCREKLDLQNELNSNQAQGCGEFGVYTFNDNNSLGIAVFGDSSALNLSQTEQTFNIEDLTSEELGIVVNEYKKNNGSFSCYNFGAESYKASHRYDAISGQVTIKINNPNVAVVDTQFHYSLDISLSNIVFKHYLREETIDLLSMDFNDIVVGYY